MSRIYPLFSSSSGNSTYIGDENGGILIDAGVSCKRICDALSGAGISPEVIRAVVVTHTHSDHISGLRVLTKKYGMPVYALYTNLEILRKSGKVHDTCELIPVDGTPDEVAGFEVIAFETPHDTPASCGFRVTTPSGRVCAVCTDLGKVTPEIDRELRLCDLVLLESNYDEKMLRYGPYPEDLKKRIASDHGHLSNPDCGRQLVRLMEAGVCRFILGHISQHNNTPETVESSAVEALRDYKRGEDYLLHIAQPDGRGKAVVF